MIACPPQNKIDLRKYKPEKYDKVIKNYLTAME